MDPRKNSKSMIAPKTRLLLKKNVQSLKNIHEVDMYNTILKCLIFKAVYLSANNMLFLDPLIFDIDDNIQIFVFKEYYTYILI